MTTTNRRTMIASTLAAIAAITPTRTFVQSDTATPKPSASPAASPVASPAADVIVAIKNIRFDPQDIEIAVGQRVTWEQQDYLGHTITDVDGAFGSEVLARGETFSVTFDNPGTVNYICALHVNMTGTVTVS